MLTETKSCSGNLSTAQFNIIGEITEPQSIIIYFIFMKYLITKIQLRSRRLMIRKMYPKMIQGYHRWQMTDLVMHLSRCEKSRLVSLLLKVRQLISISTQRFWLNCTPVCNWWGLICRSLATDFYVAIATLLRPPIHPDLDLSTLLFALKKE